MIGSALDQFCFLVSGVGCRVSGVSQGSMGQGAGSWELDVGWVERSLIGWVSFFSEHRIKDIERCLGERNPSTRVKRISNNEF